MNYKKLFKAAIIVMSSSLTFTVSAYTNSSISPVSASDLDADSQLDGLDSAFSVTRSGAAAYSISLPLPKTPSGIAPRVSFNYDSTNPLISTVGKGWSLDVATDSVSRCATSIFEQGKHDPVDLDENDRLCLRGQKLVIKYGEYGEDGAEYRLQSDPTVKITQQGNWHEPNSSFKSYLANGSTVQYGGSSLSRIYSVDDMASAPIRWLATEVTDRYDNAINYAYWKANELAETVIKNIAWSDSNQASEYSLNFEYEQSRHRNFLPIFVRGKERSYRTTLTHLVLSYESQKLADYRFTGNTKGYPDGFEKCSTGVGTAQGSTCVQTHNFIYSKGGQAIKFSAEPEIITGFAYDPSRKDNLIVDINRDGHLDYFFEKHGRWHYQLGSNDYNAGNKHIDTGIPAKKTVNRNALNPTVNPFALVHLWDFIRPVNFSFLLLLPSQLPNGDMAIQVVSQNSQSQYLIQYLAFNSAINRFYLKEDMEDIVSGGIMSAGAPFQVDLNNDDLSDVVEVYGGNVGYRIRQSDGRLAYYDEWKAFNNPSIKDSNTLDFQNVHINDDQLADFAYTIEDGDSKKYQFLTHSGRHDWKQRPIFNLIEETSTLKEYESFRDVNGDGLSDVLASTSTFNRSYYYYSPMNPDGVYTCAYDQSFVRYKMLTGRGVIFGANRYVAREYATECEEDNTSVTADARNLDEMLLTRELILGRMAVLAKVDGVWQTARDGQSSLRSTGLQYHGHHDKKFVADFNGDNIGDFAYRDGNSGNLKVHYGLYEPRRITRFENHLQAGININYGSTHSAKDDSRSIELSRFPKAAYAPENAFISGSPRVVVTSVEMDASDGRKRKTEYGYGPEIVYTDGRGSSGPLWHKIADVEKNTATKTWYSDNPRLFGYVTKSVNYRADIQERDRGFYKGSTAGGWNGILMDDSKVCTDTARGASKCTFNQFAIVENDDGTFRPYLEYSTAYEYSLPQRLSENAEGQLLKAIYTSNKAPDDYGNILESSVDTVDHSTGVTWETNTVNEYLNDSSMWIVGKLTKSTVTNSASNTSSYLPAVTRTLKFSYDPLTGALKSKEREPDKVGTPDYLKTTYYYDSWGKVDKTEVSGYDYDGKALPSRNANTVTEITTGKNGEQVLRITATNSLNHQSTSEYSLIHNGVLRTIGPNGIETNYQYNAFGRQIAELRADSNHSTKVRRASNASDHPNAAYIEIASISGAAQTEIHFDKLGNALRTVSTGLNGDKVYQDNRYDIHGRVVAGSLPYFSSESPLWAETQYDDFGRVQQVKNADGTTVSSSYQKLKTSVKNAKNDVTTTVIDVRGHVTTVTDAEQGVLSHEYNVMGQLVKTLDPLQRETQIEYDLVGRKISMDSPDMGKWTYQYNSFGELRQQKDAKGQVLTQNYDKLGRLISRAEKEGTSRWYHDALPGVSLAAAKQQRSIGKLVKVTGPNHYSEEYSYDNYGRPIETSKSIQGQKYVSSVEYDDNGRVATTIKPDGFILENVYNQHGHLIAKRSPIDQIDDYNREHLAELMQKVLDLAEQAEVDADEKLKAAEAHELKAQEYQKQADHFAKLAKKPVDIARVKRLRAIANRIRGYADRMMSIARYYQKRSEYFHSIANRFYGYAKRWAKSNRWWAGWVSRYYNWVARYYRWVAYRNARIARYYAWRARWNYYWANRIDDYANRLAVNVSAKKKAEDNAAKAKKELELAKAAKAEAEKLDKQAENYKAQAAMLSTNLQDEDYATWWRADKTDAAGRPSRQLYGNGVLTTHDYDPANGQLNYIYAGLTYGDPIQSLSYAYDANNNVIERHNDAIGSSEFFDEYDRLDRLKSWSYSSDQETDSDRWSYDAIGNIQSNTAAGQFTYGNNQHGRYSLLSTSKRGALKYDRNGNVTQRGNVHFEYSSFNKPTRLSGNDGNGHSVNTFSYAPNRSRYVQVEQYNGVTTNTVYGAVGYEKVVTTNSGKTTTAHKHHITVAGKLIAVHTRAANSNNYSRYLHYDALGSVEAITNDVGELVKRYRYHPFGKKIELQTAELLGSNNLPKITTRGFTGHEHIDGLGLIHMNARIYDPSLGRFMAADTIVQAPHDGQSYNRYAYVRNNPQKYTDPSGHSWWSDNITRRVSSSINGLERAIDRIVIEVRRSFRDIRKELCDDGCYVGGTYNGEDYGAQAGTGSTSPPPPDASGYNGTTVTTSVTFTEDGPVYEVEVGYQGSYLGYSSHNNGYYYSEHNGQRNIIFQDEIINTTSIRYLTSETGGSEDGFIDITESQINAALTLLRTAPEFVEIENAIGPLNIVKSYNGKSYYDPSDGTIGLSGQSLRFEYETTESPEFEALLQSIPDNDPRYWPLYDSYPGYYDFSLERVILHEAYHQYLTPPSSYVGSGFRGVLTRHYEDKKVISFVNRIMYRLRQEPYRLGQDEVRLK